VKAKKATAPVVRVVAGETDLFSRSETEPDA